MLGITAVAAALPDVDAIGRPFGHGDIAALGGHRAITHSVFFALVAATAIALVASRGDSRMNRWRIGAYVAVVMLSHGVLDAFTSYGEGVALFAPLSRIRWKSPWQPFDGLVSEVVALWLPAVLVYRLWLRPSFSLSSRLLKNPNRRGAEDAEVRRENAKEIER